MTRPIVVPFENFSAAQLERLYVDLTNAHAKDAPLSPRGPHMAAIRSSVLNLCDQLEHELDGLANTFSQLQARHKLTVVDEINGLLKEIRSFAIPAENVSRKNSHNDPPPASKTDVS